MVGKFGKFFFIVSVNSVFSSPPPLLSVLLLKILLQKLLRKTPLFLVSVNSVFSLSVPLDPREPPPLPCVLSSSSRASLSEQRPFYILRKLRKFNFVYRPSTCGIPICEPIMQSKTHITSNNSGYYKNAAIKKVYRPVNSEFTNNHFPRAPAEIIKECKLRSVSKSS